MIYSKPMSDKELNPTISLYLIAYRCTKRTGDLLVYFEKEVKMLSGVGAQATNIRHILS